MISDELLHKFDCIKDLPVSEEMLGAYLEGNLHESEFREVHNFIQEDNAMCDLVDSIKSDFDDMNDFGISELPSIETSFASDDAFEDFELPEISSFGIESFVNPSSPLTDDIILRGDNHNSVGEEGYFLCSDEDNYSLNHHNPEPDYGSTNIFE